MKPVWKQEKEFLEQRLNIQLPDNCWRDGSKIYLNIDTRPALVEFKAQGDIMFIKKNIIKKIKDNNVVIEYQKGNKTINRTIKSYTIEEEYKKRKHILDRKLKQSIKRTIRYIEEHPDHMLRESISGGKDSDLMHFVLQKVFKAMKIKYGQDVEIDAFNSTNEIGSTYIHMKEIIGTSYDNLYNFTKKSCSNVDLQKDYTKYIHTPKKGWYQWLSEDKNWFLPSINVRNCCSTYKEGKLKLFLDKKKDYIIFVGTRKFESAKRSHHNWDLNEAVKKAGKTLNVPENWRRFLPIVNFKNEEVWLMLTHYNIPFNHIYKFGFNRVGCLICPFASDYADQISRENFPHLMDKWDFALEKNYELYGVQKRLKWSLEEWKKGKWKQGTSKEMDLIKLKATPERIKQLAEIKGVSLDLAKKYFQRKCKNCGKSIDPDALGMNLKMFGRYEGVEDTREFMCKSCLTDKLGITKKEYGEQLLSFRNQNCNLF